MNFNDVNFVRSDNPYDSAVFYKRWSFWWLKDLFKLGLQRSIEPGDICKVNKDLESAQLTKKFNEQWEMEKSTRNPSFFNVIFHRYGVQMIGVSIVFSIFEIIFRYEKWNNNNGREFNILIIHHSQGHSIEMFGRSRDLLFTI